MVRTADPTGLLDRIDDQFSTLLLSSILELE